MRRPRGMRRQRVVAVIVALALGLPAMFGIATGIGLLVTPSVDDMPKRVDALLKQHGGARVHLNDIPDQLSEALIAIEDERFYQHSGIDTQGLIRAVLTDLYRHRALQGASTLSQQLMNAVYYGHGAYGIGMAAEIYFHRAPGELDLARASMLAGLPQSPSYYDLYRNPCSARARQFNVLAQMAHDGYISQKAADAAYAEPIGFPCK